MYKWVRLTTVLTICLLLCNLVFGWFGGNTKEHPTPTKPVTSDFTIQKATVIDGKLVVKALNQVGQVVGLEGKVDKTYTYKDSIFKSEKAIFNWLGEREYTLCAHALFKMGINVKDINPNDVVVYKDTITVWLPKPVLISLEVPYDKMEARSETGLLRNGLKEHEKQWVYGKVVESLRKEIILDRETIQKANSGVYKALDQIMSTIPHVGKVVFVAKV